MSLSDETLSIIIEGLAENRWVVIDNFLNAQICDDLVKVMQKRREEGLFRRAGIGKGEAFRVDDDVRSDTVCWLEAVRKDLTDAERYLIDQIEKLRIALNRELYLGLRDFEGHMTIYPQGGHYGRHVDRFSAHAARTVSLVIYLNRAWRPTDGGKLRIYAPGPENDLLAEVLPEAGTLAMFMSDDMPHEVTKSERERFSVTGWFRNALASPFS